MYIDNEGNHPDSCCQVYIYENFCEGATICPGNNEHYCLPIEKESAKDYKNYILEGTKLKANLITIDGILLHLILKQLDYYIFYFYYCYSK